MFDLLVLWGFELSIGRWFFRAGCPVVVLYRNLSCLEEQIRLVHTSGEWLLCMCLHFTFTLNSGHVIMEVIFGGKAFRALGVPCWGSVALYRLREPYTLTCILVRVYTLHIGFIL